MFWTIDFYEWTDSLDEFCRCEQDVVGVFSTLKKAIRFIEKLQDNNKEDWDGCNMPLKDFEMRCLHQTMSTGACVIYDIWKNSTKYQYTLILWTVDEGFDIFN